LVNAAQLLSDGLKYTLYHEHKKWIEILALEAETAIIKPDVTEQNYYRYAVAKNIKYVSHKDNVTNKRNKEEWRIINIKKDKKTTYINKSRQRENTSNTYTRI
jgi:ABC-type tungstate transport system permease subunit